jgi:hypothetical protein
MSKHQGGDLAEDVLFSTSLGMPKTRSILRRPMRIMGFLRMDMIETVGIRKPVVS